MATYNSSSITRGEPPRLGVYETKVLGVIHLGNITLTLNDILPICLIPPGSFISSCFINFPIVSPAGANLTISLLDSLASPTTYISSSSKGTNFTALTNFSMVDFLQAVTGTQYGFTARAIGAAGAPVVVWASGVQLRLKVTASSTTATGGAMDINYIIGFSPIYDAGV